MKKLLTLFVIATVVLFTTCKKDAKDLPVASFFYSPASAGVGDTIYFQSNCQNANTYEWDFGDGNGSTEVNPYHIFTQEGSYTVQLTAYNDDGSDMTSKTVQIQPPSCWNKLRDLPTARNGHIAVLLDNKIYVAGGINTWNEFEAYDISTNTWEAKADMPGYDREFLAGCVLNGKIYLIGGYYGLEGIFTTDFVEVYDPATNKWETKTPMPSQRWGHAAFPFNGKIYVVGGALDWPIKKFYTTIEVYDPTSDSWTTLNRQDSKGLTGRWGFGACMANDKIYIVGGTDAMDYPPSGNVPSLDIVDVYDPATNIWTKKTPMPTARWGLVSVTDNNRIYAIGGGNVYEATAFRKAVEEYDPVSNKWVKKDAMPEGVLVAAACMQDNIIYIPGGGGLTSNDAYNSFYSYDPVCDTVSE